MTNERIPQTVEPMLQHEDRLAHIPQSEFAAAWRALVGEPPAVMLESRSEMIRILVDSTQGVLLPKVGMLDLGN